MSTFPRPVRTAIVLRDEGRCVGCGRAVAVVLDDRYHQVAPFSIHHRVLKGMGGRSTDNRAVNGLTLCGSGTTGCHGRTHHSRDWAASRGYIVAADESPETVPVVVAVAPGQDAVVGLDDDRRFALYPTPGGNR